MTEVRANEELKAGDSASVYDNTLDAHEMKANGCFAKRNPTVKQK